LKKSIIIAEAGVNHNGDIALAYKMVDKAKEAGADIVKFQTAKPELVISKFAPKAEYQKANTQTNESQLEMCKKLHLKFDEYIGLKNYCDKIGIDFMSTPFDLDSIAFLDSIDMPAWKISSGEITNLPYLIKIANTHKPIILSTGMCNIAEIEDALKILQENGCGVISLLHCTTEYPAPYEDVNLNAIKTLRETFKCEVGYSDHTEGIEIAIAAVAMGATIIEKHFTLDKNMEGPDHKASLEPNELKTMIAAIRNVEKAMGSGEKKPSTSEIKNISIARKSIVAKFDIHKGTVFTEENITTKRPGNGVSPMMWYAVLGKKAQKDFQEDELIIL
jgi:N,N'-diacetyllegionaminate synthase